MAMTTQVTASTDLPVIHMTFYSPESCPGTITATGATVRKGIAAVTKEHIGDCAALYTLEGEFIGYFECLDKIGTGASKVIDVWMPSDAEGYDMIAQYGDKVRVNWIKEVKG